ncbi:beta strand repeat-containing protein, partial [Clostridium tagluense]|uniref:beta strand repeat-containing protein n=1 Tax=Clostridium tagluense TaxID=360422 RepID=UPI001CF1B7C7
MNKKIISSALAALMVAGSTSFSAFAAMPNGTVVIGTKSFSLDYANDPANAVEIGNEIVAGGLVYAKDFNGDWLDNRTGLKIAASVIPSVVYKNAEKKVNYDIADKDFANKGAVAVSTASELTTALANNNVTEITLTNSFTASPTVTRPLTINFGTYTLTGNVSFNYTEKGTSVLTGTAGNRIIGNLMVNTYNASFNNGVKVSGPISAEPRTWTESADGNALTIIGSNGTSIVVDGNPRSVIVAGAATVGMTLAVNAGSTVTNITSNANMNILIAKGAMVTNITATAGSGGSTIINHGTIGTVTADIPVNLIPNASSSSTITGQAGIVTVTGMGSDTVVSPVVKPSDNNHSGSLPADIVVSAITITGNAVVGATLTAAPTPTNATVTYQWQKSDTAGGTYTNIGTNSNTYVPGANDAGKFIKVTITGTGRYSGTATSVAKAVASSDERVNSVATISDKNVANGTSLNAVGLPTNVNITLSDTTTTNAAITWDGGSPTYDGNAEGSYTFNGTITLPTGVTNPNNIKASVRVNVAAPVVQGKTISSIAAISDRNVANGTSLNAVGLPTNVDITLSDTTTTSAAVTWDGAIPTYNKNAEGLYTFSGTITLPKGVTNPNDVKASVKVNVAAAVVVQSKTISSVAAISDKNVANGTSLNAVGLPTNVDITLSDTTTTSAAVTWD